MSRRWLNGFAVLAASLVVSPARAQWESGSDGTDGAFNPAVSTEVDLGLAASLCDCDGDSQIDDPCRWNCPSPVPGRGVYDAEQWVIVYKYSTINVPSGVTVTFKNHPSNPPVVWLATGNVTISGIVDLNGRMGSANTPIPTFTVPGPGGFEGGQAGHAGLAITNANIPRGFGPGSGPNGGGAAYGTPSGGGATYGTSEIQPLIGGSGGGGQIQPNTEGGASGAGAILIASDTSISLASSGIVRANGAWPNGPGSAGAIRLRADTITAQSGSAITANQMANGGSGRIRMEAFSITNNASMGDAVLSVTSIPSVVFVSNPPQLRIVAMCGEAAPAEPAAGISSTELEINEGGPCTINIEARSIPLGTTVGVRVIPARGLIVTATSTPLIDAGGGLRTATATLTMPPGLSEVQLRANW